MWRLSAKNHRIGARGYVSMIEFIGGVFVGGVIGVLAMCLVTAGRDEDDADGY